MRSGTDLATKKKAAKKIVKKAAKKVAKKRATKKMSTTKKAAKKKVAKKAVTPPKAEAVDQKAKKALLKAVKEDGSALEYADKSLKADRDIVLAAVKQNGYALEYAAKSLKADRDIVLAAVKQDGDALSFADKSFRADRKVVLAAVKTNGYALIFADKTLKADHEIVFAAVRQDVEALEYASEELQQDEELRQIAGIKEIAKAKEVEELSPYFLAGPELTYYDWIVKKKDLNSIEKIRGFVSDVIEGGESESTAHLVLGTLESNKGNKLDEVHLLMEDQDGDVVEFSIKNRGELIERPKKGEIVFVYFYYYDHSSYTLEPKKKLKNICFEIKSFQGEAVLTKRHYPGFELIAEDAGGGGEFRLEVLCDDGQSFEGTVENKEELITEVSDYLLEQE